LVPLGVEKLSAPDLLLVFAVSLASVPLFVLALTAPPVSLRLTDTGHLAFMVAHYGVAFAAIYYFIIHRRAVRWFEVGLRPVSSPWLLSAACIAISGALLAAVSVQAIRTPLEPPPELLELTRWGAGAFAFLIVLCVVAPVSEELLFRGVLYAWLRSRFGVGLGVVLSALAFYLAHIWSLHPLHFVLGVMLALLYERSGSLLLPVVLHGAFNLAAALALSVRVPPASASTGLGLLP
jgi:membrane protease YdiL (CAAX protease family)